VNGSIGLSRLGFFWAVALIVSVASVSPAATEGNADRGARIFAANCARCHGQQGRGNGPDLVKLQSAVSPDDWTDRESNQELTDSFIVAMIIKGGKANGKSRLMPAFGDKLNAQQVQDLLAFIRSLPK
jgi:mono/diheme cytochrome c family protein